VGRGGRRYLTTPSYPMRAVIDYAMIDYPVIAEADAVANVR
jgi:hypothetical protein